MPLLSMNEMTTYRWGLEQDVSAYLEAGYSSIGVWRQKLSDFDERLERGIELLRKSGLKVSNLLWAGGFTGSDDRTYRESVQDAFEAVRLAAQLEARSLVVYSGGRAGHTHNHARRLIKDALRQLAPLAEELGVLLAVEPMHHACSADWTFLNSLDDVLALIDEVKSPHVKFVFDTYHLGREPRILSRIPDCVPHLAVVHLGDGKTEPSPEHNRCRLGEGNIPLKEIVSALTAAGYDGYYDVELMGEDIEARDYQELLQHSKRVFQQLTASSAT